MFQCPHFTGEETEGQRGPLVRDNGAKTGTQVFLDPLVLSHSPRLGLGWRLRHCLAFLELLGGAGALPSGLVP